MTDFNPSPEIIKAKIENIVETGEGAFLPNYYGMTLDGSDVAEYMYSLGFHVVTHYDSGSCGITLLDVDGKSVSVSTNGYCHLSK